MTFDGRNSGSCVRVSYSSLEISAPATPRLTGDWEARAACSANDVSIRSKLGPHPSKAFFLIYTRLVEIRSSRCTLAKV
jgi:hypothetical protein